MGSGKALARRNAFGWKGSLDMKVMLLHWGIVFVTSLLAHLSGRVHVIFGTLLYANFSRKSHLNFGEKCVSNQVPVPT